MTEVMSSLSSTRFYGKYRGIVMDNVDTKKLGRIRAKVETVLGDKILPWAVPCVPYAGKNVGIFFIPPIGARVWIEFENGDVCRPIFSGCYWNENDLPDKNYDPNIKIIKTEYATITINDIAGENKIEIETNKEDQKIVMKPNSLELSHKGCNIILTSNDVSINGKNLQVLK